MLTLLNLVALANEPARPPLDVVPPTALLKTEEPVVLTPRSQAGVLLTVGGLAGLVTAGVTYGAAENKLHDLLTGSSSTREFNHDRAVYNRFRVLYYQLGLLSLGAIGTGQTLLLIDNLGTRKEPLYAVEIRHTF